MSSQSATDFVTAPIEQGNDMDDGDWEEWDGRSPFWAHCVAGSLAGVVEHAAIYPLDTVRTHIQVCAACVHRLKSANVTPVPSGTNAVTASAAHTAWTMPSRSHSSAKFTTTAVATTPPSVASVGASTTAATVATPPHHRLPLGMWQTIRFLVNEPVVATATTMDTLLPRAAHSLSNPATTAAVNNLTKGGFTRLFRGVQTILIGCVPAHALYFSSYETIKAYHINETTGHVTAFGSSLAGAAAVTSHDLVMTPLDTLKQRLQIGHYSGAWQAVHSIYRQEGFVALYRSFPITLASNIPYGMVMVSTHEACKTALKESLLADRPQWQIVLGASSIAGFVASAVTTPLDRIKTALQTQQLAPVCQALQAPCPLTNSMSTVQPKHVNWHQAALTIWKEEGAAGFFRGMAPRILSHTPAVAISWTTYETAKHYLLSH